MDVNFASSFAKVDSTPVKSMYWFAYPTEPGGKSADIAPTEHIAVSYTHLTLPTICSV